MTSDAREINQLTEEHGMLVGSCLFTYVRVNLRSKAVLLFVVAMHGILVILA